MTGRGSPTGGLALALLTVLAACSDPSAPPPADVPLDPLQRILARPQPPMRTDAPEALVASVLELAARTRARQAEAGRRSWNALHAFVHGTFWRATPLARALPRTIEDAEPLARLDYEVLGRIPAPDVRPLVLWGFACGALARGPFGWWLDPTTVATAPPVPAWRGVAVSVRVACLDVPPPPGETLRRDHPIPTTVAAYARGELAESRFVFALRTVPAEGRWWLAVPQHVLLGLVLGTGGL